MRSQQFLIRLSPEERARLDALAAERGLTRADVLRQLLRGEIRPPALATAGQSL